MKSSNDTAKLKDLTPKQIKTRVYSVLRDMNCYPDIDFTALSHQDVVNLQRESPHDTCNELAEWLLDSKTPTT